MVASHQIIQSREDGVEHGHQHGGVGALGQGGEAHDVGEQDGGVLKAVGDDFGAVLEALGDGDGQDVVQQVHHPLVLGLGAVLRVFGGAHVGPNRPSREKTTVMLTPYRVASRVGSISWRGWPGHRCNPMKVPMHSSSTSSLTGSRPEGRKKGTVTAVIR